MATQMQAVVVPKVNAPWELQNVTAVTHRPDKEDLARRLGAGEVVTNGAGLKAAGGADLIMCTGSNHSALASAMDGLRPWGKVVMMGIATDELALPALPLVSNSHQIIGSAHNGYFRHVRPVIAHGRLSPAFRAPPVCRSVRVGGSHDR